MNSCSEQINCGLSRLFRKLLLLSIWIILLIPSLPAQWTINDSDIYNSNSGNVGVGITNPSYKLDVAGSVRSTGPAMVGVLENSGGAVPVQNIVRYVDADGTTWRKLATVIFTPGTYRGAHFRIMVNQFWHYSQGLDTTYEYGVTMRRSNAVDLDSLTAEVDSSAGGDGIRVVRTQDGDASTNTIYEIQYRCTGGAAWRVLNVFPQIGFIASGSVIWASTADDVGATTGTVYSATGSINSSYGNVYSALSGNVGIGTTNPNVAKLVVRGSVTTGVDFISSAMNSAGEHLATAFDEDNNLWLFRTSGVARPIVFSMTGSEKVRIDTNGNVGIGTTNPQTKLQVEGNVVVNGNLAAKYQDLAEWVPSAKGIEAGYVVVTDPNLPGHVLPSSEAYDTRVAGVVSEMPGIVLGESGEGKVKVATVGRVKVKVDATRSPIQIGDLLVTSATPGVAMKSEPIDVGGRKIHQPGTLLGKALESIASGIGEIVVLLSLQ